MKEKDGLPVGTVAWWTNRFDEEKVGVLIEESTLQLYKLRRHGFKPQGNAIDVKDWVLKEIVEKFSYIVNGQDIFLVI